MNEKELKDKLSNITIWKKSGQRAPHKPLLLLYALAQLQANKRYIPFSVVKDKLTDLLIEFGPKRQSHHPEQPFTRLTHDGIWELVSNVEIDTKNPKFRLLLDLDVKGGFTDQAFKLLKNSGSLINEVTELILQNHFPDTLHEDILSHVGLDLEYNLNRKRKRDPHFRERILKAYEYSCAVCGFNVRLGQNVVGIEAAHIKWHQAGGPDEETNGIALCSLHHKLFDRGVFTLSDEHIFLVTEEAHGTIGFQESLMKYHGEQIRKPIHPDYRPNTAFLGWHVREVFKGRERYIG